MLMLFLFYSNVYIFFTTAPSLNSLVDEELLVEDIRKCEYDNKDMNELDDLITFLEAKESWSRGTDPTAPCQSIPANKIMFLCSCNDCEMILEYHDEKHCLLLLCWLRQYLYEQIWLWSTLVWKAWRKSLQLQ